MVIYRLKFFLLLDLNKIEFVKDELVSQSYLDEQGITIMDYAIQQCGILQALDLEFHEVVYMCTQSLLEV